MEIEYTVQESDFIAFSEYHNAHSPSAQATFRRNTYGYGAWFLGLGLFSLLIGETSLGVSFLLTSPLWVVYWPKWAKGRYRKQAAALWREGRNPTSEGSHTLRLDDAGLTLISPLGESRIPLTAVQKIEATARLLLIYLGAVQAIIVPRERVLRGDIDKFGSEAQRLRKAV